MEKANIGDWARLIEALEEFVTSEKKAPEVDMYVMKFFDFGNIEKAKNKPLKIKVIKEAADGKTIDEIGEDFFKILDKYPGHDQLWD